MPSRIPHQKFCFYHLPTRGWAGIKLGDAWYVSNVSIIFYCSMLLYCLFWMFNGLYYALLYYVWDQPINRRPSANCCFLPISVFRRKGISNGVQTEWNLRESYFWNKRDLGDLEWTSRNKGGRHEAGGTPTPLGAPSTLVGPPFLHRRTSSSYIYLRTPKTSRSTMKDNFHRCYLLYLRDPILEPSSALRRRGNRPRRASTSSPRPL